MESHSFVPICLCSELAMTSVGHQRPSATAVPAISRTISTSRPEPAKPSTTVDVMAMETVLIRKSSANTNVDATEKQVSSFFIWSNDENIGDS